MRYAIYNFSLNERTEAMPRVVITEKIDIEVECRVFQATTVEDERYLGTYWQCDHCIEPHECGVCNPTHRHRSNFRHWLGEAQAIYAGTEFVSLYWSFRKAGSNVTHSARKAAAILDLCHMSDFGE